MGSAEPPAMCYLAEWYRPDLTAQPVDDIAAKLTAAADTLTAQGTPVRLLMTVAVPRDEVLYGVFTADSPELVIEACACAGIPLERLTGDVNAQVAQAG